MSPVRRLKRRIWLGDDIAFVIHIDLAFEQLCRRVVADGFYALQQATFASPKRKSIQAYQDFVTGGGTLYVPTPEQKAAFKAAAAPVYDWFKSNVDGGEEVFDAMVAAAEEAAARIDALNGLAAN